MGASKSCQSSLCVRGISVYSTGGSVVGSVVGFVVGSVVSSVVGSEKITCLILFFR